MKARADNGGFNLYSGTSRIPYNLLAENFNATDGKDTLYTKEGIAAVKVTGTGAIKTLTQNINLLGKPKDILFLSLYLQYLRQN